MKYNETMKLPANYTALTRSEQAEATGGAAADTAVKAVVAVGVSAALLCVAGVAAAGILSLFGGEGGLGAVIDRSLERGGAFGRNAVEAGRSLLDALLPW